MSDSFRVHTYAAGKRKRRTAQHRSSRVTTFAVDARVWATALELANGDVRRIQILSDKEVRVANGPLA